MESLDCLPVGIPDFVKHGSLVGEETIHGEGVAQKGPSGPGRVVGGRSNTGDSTQRPEIKLEELVVDILKGAPRRADGPSFLVWPIGRGRTRGSRRSPSGRPPPAGYQTRQRLKNIMMSNGKMYRRGTASGRKNLP